MYSDVHVSAVIDFGPRSQSVIALFEAAEIILSVFDVFGKVDGVRIVLALQVRPSPMVEASPRCLPEGDDLRALHAIDL